MRKKEHKPHELSEDEAYEIALGDHPEWRDALADGSLPDELLDEHGNVITPRMHLRMHAVVECQLAADTPPGIRAIARELQALGVSEHDVRHYLAQPVAEQIWATMHEGRTYDEAEHLRRLREIVDSLR